LPPNQFPIPSLDTCEKRRRESTAPAPTIAAIVISPTSITGTSTSPYCAVEVERAVREWALALPLALALALALRPAGFSADCACARPTESEGLDATVITSTTATTATIATIIALALVRLGALLCLFLLLLLLFVALLHPVNGIDGSRGGDDNTAETPALQPLLEHGSQTCIIRERGGLFGQLRRHGRQGQQRW
jgi:hypothetical protein